jgi:hypothetical protein
MRKIIKWTFLIFILSIVIFSCKNKQPKANFEKESRLTYYKEFYDLRVSDDKKIFSLEQLAQIESQYKMANKKINSPEAIIRLDSLVNNEKYKGANRIGCALLYLGQMSTDDRKEKYLLKAKSEYSNSWYGDGVNVGAYATYELYFYYKYIGNENEAKKYRTELLHKYSDYIDHKQIYIKDILATENL